MVCEVGVIMRVLDVMWMCSVYNKGYGRLHVVNINGDRDILSLRQNPLLTKLKDVAESDFGDAE